MTSQKFDPLSLRHAKMTFTYGLSIAPYLCDVIYECSLITEQACPDSCTVSIQKVRGIHKRRPANTDILYSRVTKRPTPPPTDVTSFMNDPLCD